MLPNPQVLGLLNQQKMTRGQTRNSGKALSWPLLQRQGARISDSFPCSLALQQGPSWFLVWSESWVQLEACVHARARVCVCVCVCVLVPHSSPNSLRSHGLQLARLLCPWNSPGKDTGVGSHSLLQGIFPTQELKPNLLHWQADSLSSELEGQHRCFPTPQAVLCAGGMCRTYPAFAWVSSEVAVGFFGLFVSFVQNLQQMQMHAAILVSCSFLVA